MRSAIFAVSVVFAGLATPSAFAAKPATTKVQLLKEATHIVVGTVSDIRSASPQTSVIVYTARIAISTVEKGSGLRSGETIDVRYIARGLPAGAAPVPSDSGHRPRPAKGDKVRVYLVNKGYNGAGYTTDGRFDVYYKNGFEILPR